MKPASLLILLLLTFLLSAEEVCKFSYRNDPASLDKKELELPQGSVAMSEFVHINNESSVIQTGGSSSIFFVIDNSNSMFIENNGSGNPKPLGFDIDGARYLATSALIDSIYAISPDSRVGLSLFSTNLYFDPADDALFQTLDKFKSGFDVIGGFVPLLKLNEKVSVGKYSGMTGYEVLKDILNVKQYTGRQIWVKHLSYFLDIPEYTNLVYEPSDYNLDPVKINELGGSSGTNIWAGFAAAKEAMLSSPHTKDNQHIIFYSDGSYSVFGEEGPHSFYWDDSTSQNCPTTYTVFFDEGNSVAINALTNLKDMIKTNGFSSSNVNSDIWAISAGTEVLVSLFMDNVIKEVITNVKSIVPKNIVVKGLIPVTDWDGDGFLFNSEFALTGVSTPIEYSIEYEIWYDSISGIDTVKVKDKDTSLVFSYDAVIKDNPNTPDSCILTWWGRSLSLQENGSDLTVIEDRSGIIDVNLSEYKVDTLYEYSNVNIEITTNSGDHEILSLSKSGDIHSSSITREVGIANTDDGVIQYNSIDEITFKFANPKLPLDTLEKRVEVNAQGMLVVKSIVYKDSDANGFLDRVILNVSGDDLEANSQTIVDSLEFPAERNLTIDNVAVSGNSINVDVSENSGVIRTSVESFDYYSISDTLVLNNDIILAPFSLSAIDSMAPVILSASMIDSVKDGAKDFITIAYSESVANENDDDCLAFYKKGTGSIITATKSYVSTSGTNALYELSSHSIESGDSVNINSGAVNSVKDANGIIQSNVKNRKVEIDVTLIEDRLYVISGSYHDDNADGWVDRIGVNLSQNIDSKYLDVVQQNIDLGTLRNLTVDSSRYNDGKITLLVTENGTIANTNTEADIISVNDSVVLSDELILTPSSISVNDSMAPVVLSAHLKDSVKIGAYDYLGVKFSEIPQNLNADNCLDFYKNGTSALFNEVLEFVELIADSAIYRINNAEIKQGDSLNVNSGASTIIIDGNSNEQLNADNIKVEINVDLIEDNLYLTSCTYYDDDANGLVDRVALTLNYEIDNGILNEIVNRLNFENSRDFNIESSNINEDVITLIVAENSDNFSTSTEGEIVSIDDSLKISDELILIAANVSVIDSMAPVIIEAQLVDSVITETKGKETYISLKGDDYLSVTFSEDISEIVNRDPFVFHNNGNYDASVELLELKGDIAEFRMIDKNIIEDGDSVSISFSNVDSVSEMNSIVQKNINNRRCPIQITVVEAESFVPAEIEFILKTTVLEYDKYIEMPGDWSTEEGKSGVSKDVMVITIEPDDIENYTNHDNISANVTVFDNLGNLIKGDMEMSFNDENKSLYLLWSGKNSRGRLVGSGAYVLVAKLNRYFDEEILPTEGLKATVGVKCSKK